MIKEESSSVKSKRIAKNTLVLYFRMIFLMLVTLYTSRVILDALGVNDYGIYNVVGGFVSLFALISAALTSACSRFLNFEMGTGDKQRQNVVFSTALTIQWTLALIVFTTAELVGVWYVNNIMVLPTDRLPAANWCFQFSVLTFCMNLITVPYNASIIAHEKMKTFAYVSIYQGLATLAISFLVKWNPFDRLIYYALLLFIVQFTVRFVYQVYCRKKFEECHYKRVFDKPLLKSMLTFSTWHFIGNGSVVLKNQGVNIILNLFFGPAINAARGLAVQVDTAVTQFSNNFMIAMNPQITQSYAKGDLTYMFKLINFGTRFSFYLLLLLSLPIILNAHFILSLWLKHVPDYTAIFVQLSLISVILNSISSPLMKAQNATGNVRDYQLAIGGIFLLNLPLSYLALSLEYDAESVFVVALVLDIIGFFVRIFLVPRTLKEFRPVQFLNSVCVNCLIVSIVSIPLPLFAHFLLDEDFLTFATNVSLCFTSVLLSEYFIGCNKEERTFILNKWTKNKI